MVSFVRSLPESDFNSIDLSMIVSIISETMLRTRTSIKVHVMLLKMELDRLINFWVLERTSCELNTIVTFKRAEGVLSIKTNHGPSVSVISNSFCSFGFLSCFSCRCCISWLWSIYNIWCWTNITRFISRVSPVMLNLKWVLSESISCLFVIIIFWIIVQMLKVLAWLHCWETCSIYKLWDIFMSIMSIGIQLFYMINNSLITFILVTVITIDEMNIVLFLERNTLLSCCMRGSSMMSWWSVWINSC